MNLSRVLTFVLCLTLTALVFGSGATWAQERDRRGFVLDYRYGHNHYYPRHGYVVGVVPEGSLMLNYSGLNWYYHAGIWFRPTGPRYVVSPPPIGIVVPVLPPAYSTVMIAGVAYYYANGVYYSPVPSGYAVVSPPSGGDSVEPMPVPVGEIPGTTRPLPGTGAPVTVSPQVPLDASRPRVLPEPIVYPRSGQSPVQTQQDRQECNQWASSQPNASNDAMIFRRALEACMDGRGYTIR